MNAQTIGLVEDSEEDFTSFARILAREAPEMELRRWARAETLLDTLADESARDTWPQVLVIDLNLPGMDGCELVRRLRANPATQSVPAFILSGSDRQVDIDRCYAAGANAYLTKPGNVSELRALLQMLLRSIASFKAPTPIGSPGAVPTPDDEGPPADPVVVDQASIDRHRDDYERRLIDERDAERRGRRRAEALQRLTARLANTTTVDQVEAELIRACGGPSNDRTARVDRTAPGESHAEPLLMPDPFGDGTIAILPLMTDRGASHGTLRVDAPGDIDEEDEAFLHAAASLGGQALSRLTRVAARGPGAAAVDDLPTAAWWQAAAGEELAGCLRGNVPLTAVAVELQDLPAYTAAFGYVAADHLLLALGNSWRAAGYDLMSPYGTEQFMALLPGHTAAQAALVVDQVASNFDADHDFVVGFAQWNRREDADSLLARSLADLTARRRR